MGWQDDVPDIHWQWALEGDPDNTMPQACEYCDNWHEVPGRVIDEGFCVEYREYVAPDHNEACDDFDGSLPSDFFERWE